MPKKKSNLSFCLRLGLGLEGLRLKVYSFKDFRMSVAADLLILRFCIMCSTLKFGEKTIND